MRAQLCLPAARARDEMRGRASDPRAEAVRPERVGAGSVLDAVVDEHRAAWPSAGSQLFQVLQAVDVPKILERWLARSRKLGIAAHTRDPRALGVHSGFRQYWIGRLSQRSQRRPAQAHLRSPSISAQARATDELTTSLPGSVAQPPFSTKEVCCQELTFFSLKRFASAPAARRNLSTQMGASAAMTALLALLPAISLAVLPSVHPPQPKPMTTVARNPMNAPCRSRLSESPCRIEGTCMGGSFRPTCVGASVPDTRWVPVDKLN